MKDQKETRAQPAGAIFDPEVALEKCFNSSKMLQEMIECFLLEMESIFPQMRSALEKKDLTEVGRLGHRMKGTVIYLGAEPAKEAALRVEQFCLSSDGTPEAAGQAINELERECETLKSALTEYSRTPPDPVE